MGSHYEFRGSYSQGVRFFRLRKPNPAVTGATGQWSLDEGDGQSAQDTATGQQSLRLSKTSWAVGRFGPGALAFNGGPAATVGSRAWISNANYQTLPGPNRPFSLSFWFNPDSLNPGSSALAGNDVAVSYT